MYILKRARGKVQFCNCEFDCRICGAGSLPVRWNWIFKNHKVLAISTKPKTEATDEWQRPLDWTQIHFRFSACVPRRAVPVEFEKIWPKACEGQSQAIPLSCQFPFFFPAKRSFFPRYRKPTHPILNLIPQLYDFWHLFSIAQHL